MPRQVGFCLTFRVLSYTLKQMSSGTMAIDDVVFDHDAAFRASRSADEVLRALDDVADARVRLANDILCSCSGPYADSLRADVDGATRAVESLAEQVRSIRSRIAAARDDAFVAQVRVEVRRATAAQEAA